MTEPAGELNADFSQPGATPPPWSRVAAMLEEAEIFWLSTVRGDGRPHVTPLPAIWDRGALHFCTGTEEQKTKNLGRDPRCVLTTGTNRLRSGLDVVVEGIAERIVDHARLVELAALWESKLDWPFEVGEDTFSDGIHTAWVYAVRPAKVLAFGKGEFSQTRFRF
jgi:general stress protein 26